jgi:multidrug resistance efflux pump
VELSQLPPEVRAAAEAMLRPKPQEPRPQHGLELLLKLEAETRRSSTVKELCFLIANETIKLTRSRQIFVLTAPAPRAVRVTTVSGVSQFDRRSQQIRWIESLVKNLAADTGLTKVREFELPAYCPEGDTHNLTYPFRAMLWVPFLAGNGKVFAGMLLARDTPWGDSDRSVPDRLAETYAHAWAALEGPRRLARQHRRKGLYSAIASLALVVGGLIPVPLRVLAPMDIAAVNAKVVAAPMDGIVESITVEPNSLVKTGDVIIHMSDTALRNEQAVALQEVTVAEARLKAVMQAAINDPKMRREIAIARAEVEVKKARLAYAEDMLSRAIVRSPSDGIAVYTDRRDWQGRPVQTGERIVDVANPGSVELRIFIPVGDSIAVKEGASVKAFLDTDPLNAVDAIVSRISYEARPYSGSVLSYQVLASLPEGSQNHFRLGTHGTAQVSGDHVPLAFWLLRKPLTAVRQWIGL